MPFTFYPQLNAMDCGPTCLPMVAKYYGRHFNADSLRQKAGFSKDVVSLLGISETAEQNRFQDKRSKTLSKAVGRSAASLHFTLESKSFCGFNFIIKKLVKIADPGKGIINYTNKEFKGEVIIMKKKERWLIIFF